MVINDTSLSFVVWYWSITSVNKGYVKLKNGILESISSKCERFGLTLFGPGFFQPLKTKMPLRHNSCFSSQMKLKFGSDIIWIMFTSNFFKKLMKSSLFLFL